ncbi:MarR family winged helix-turn-helix transcriptional regulator [Catenulispora rubra]|uniref:MarR family winged helix-turn-helix transcriptional regulator n=1 Tax=Catenulispora rubra TaxID=280293 RepID=UPI0018928771|nr:MarR family transcriptional regulator [Catenulispora rubra]
MEVNDGSVLALLGQLSAVARHVRRGTEQNPADETTMRVLALAAQRDGARPSEVAVMLDVAHPSVTRHVKRLEEAGYVRIEADPSDGRSYLIHPTATGSALLEDFRLRLVARFTPVLEGWDPAEVDSLTAALARLNDAMAAAVSRDAEQPVVKNRWRADPQPMDGAQS